MVFLIDYENTWAEALNGTNLLTKDDKLIVFHNQTQLGIPKYYADQIVAKCDIEHITLTRKGKNGIDFYIGTTVGELLGKNPNEEIAILSKDTGYQAVYDFCKAKYGKNIILAANICSAINIKNSNLSMDSIIEPGKNQPFQQIISNRNAKVKKDRELEVNKELCSIAKIEVNVNDLELVKISTTPSPMAMYNKLLHKYGKKEGHRIYHCLKDNNKVGSMKN